MPDYEPDIVARAEEWALQPGRETALPIMNFRPGRLPPALPGGRYSPLPPKLFSCAQLLPYFLVVHCTCGRVTEVSGGSAAKLIGKADRAPIRHLLSVLICGTCGGRPAMIEIGREADRGLPDQPHQVVVASNS